MTVKTEEEQKKQSEELQQQPVQATNRHSATFDPNSSADVNERYVRANHTPEDSGNNVDSVEELAASTQKHVKSQNAQFQEAGKDIIPDDLELREEPKNIPELTNEQAATEAKVLVRYMKEHKHSKISEIENEAARKSGEYLKNNHREVLDQVFEESNKKVRKQQQSKNTEKPAYSNEELSKMFDKTMQEFDDAKKEKNAISKQPEPDTPHNAVKNSVKRIVESMRAGGYDGNPLKAPREFKTEREALKSMPKDLVKEALEDIEKSGKRTSRQNQASQNHQAETPPPLPSRARSTGEGAKSVGAVKRKEGNVFEKLGEKLVEHEDFIKDFKKGVKIGVVGTAAVVGTVTLAAFAPGIALAGVAVGAGVLSIAAIRTAAKDIMSDIRKGMSAKREELGIEYAGKAEVGDKSPSSSLGKSGSREATNIR